MCRKGTIAPLRLLQIRWSYPLNNTNLEFEQHLHFMDLYTASKKGNGGLAQIHPMD